MKINNTFKKIEGAKNYVAGILGEIWNIKTNKILKDSSNGWAGYRQVSISFADGSRKSKTVHKLVYEAFYGQVPNGLEISHIDDTKDNNCLSNLCLMTRKQNLNHGDWKKRKSESMRNGTGLRKMAEMNRKFTRSQDTIDKHREMSKKYWADRKEAV